MVREKLKPGKCTDRNSFCQKKMQKYDMKIVSNELENISMYNGI